MDKKFAFLAAILAIGAIQVAPFPSIAPFYAESNSIGSVRNGSLTHEFWISQAYTDSQNFQRTKIQSDTGGGYATIQTERQTSGSNAVASGLCLGTNNNTANRWCISAAIGGGVVAGSMYMGATPNLIWGNATPTIGSGFGTSPSVVTGGKVYSFQVNVGTGGAATTGVVTFNTTFQNAPSCTASPSATNGVTRTTSTTTQVTLNSTTAWTASDILSVHCTGF